MQKELNKMVLKSEKDARDGEMLLSTAVRPVRRKIKGSFADERTFGERLADGVARFGGSWTFLILFGCIITAWIVTNSYFLFRANDQFDPYPYILLNLFLSMLAALQAPVILMSQNRQDAKDRLAAEHNYEVTSKAEVDLRLLHEKLDELRERKWMELVNLQQRQLKMLERLLETKR